MSFLGSIFGGSSGAGFQAQQAPVITDPNLLANSQAAYTQNQGDLQNQRNLVGAMQGASPDIFAQQQQLAGQLQQSANGQGPNPALQQLQNTTGQNVANQASLMAGQRGSSANAGLLARQAAQQGANTQQQAVGQGAALAAQQQLAARQQLQGQQAQIASQQIGSQQNLGQQSLAAQQALQNQLAQQNQSQVANVSQANQANASIAAQNAKQQGGMASGLLNGVGTVLGQFGDGLSDMFGSIGGALGGAASGLGGMAGGAADAVAANPEVLLAANGGMIPRYAKGGPTSKLGQHMHNMKSGGHVPGQAQAAGDNYKNDTVHAMLSPGEVVIPRSIMQGKNPKEGAAKFVAAVLAKKGIR